MLLMQVTGLIDTAQGYGNEASVGKAIAESSVKREELFITTKLWLRSAGYDATKLAFEDSLSKLGLDYLDLYLIHQPFGDYYGAWRAMEELYKEGRIRAIGVSNFYGDRLTDLILNHDIVPAVDQLAMHVFNQQKAMRPLLDKHHIQLEAWGPLSQGKQNVFHNEVLVEIAKTHNKTVAQIILGWLNQQNIVAIPKSVHKNRITENFDVFDFKLSVEEIKKIESLDMNETYNRVYDPNFVESIYNYKV